MRHPGTALRSFVVTSLLAAGTAVAAPGDNVQCIGIDVRSGASALKGNATPQFSATGVLDLTFAVQTSRNLKGEHLVQLRVFTPSHGLYQSIDVPVVDPSGTPGARKLAGYPFPVAEKKPKDSSARGASSWAIEAAFPVGGTVIGARGIYGTWTVEATWDGARFCGAQPFVITP